MSTLEEIAGYRIESRIAGGSWGEVYRASQSSLGRQVALKILRDAREAEDPNARKRFLREAKIQLHLKHPNLVQCLDYGCEDGVRFIALELVEGMDLRKWWERTGEKTPETLRRVWADIASALVYLHRQGVVHRDVKPENVLVSTDGRVKLGDLGLARWDRETLLTQTGEIMGTVPYLAPEILGSDPFHPALDIYALGAMIHELWCGRLPIEKIRLESYTDQVSDRIPVMGDARFGALPVPLRRLIDAQLEADPAARPSAEKLLESLTAEPGRKDEQARPGEVPEHAPITPRIGLGGTSELSGTSGPRTAPRRRGAPIGGLIAAFLVGAATGSVGLAILLPRPILEARPDPAAPLVSPAAPVESPAPAVQQRSHVTEIIPLFATGQKTMDAELALGFARRRLKQEGEAFLGLFLVEDPSALDDVSLVVHDRRGWEAKAGLDFPDAARINGSPPRVLLEEGRAVELSIPPSLCRSGINLVTFFGGVLDPAMLRADLRYRLKESAARPPRGLNEEEKKVVDSFTFHLEMSNLVTAGQISEEYNRDHPDHPIGWWSRGFLALRRAHHERFFGRPGIHAAGAISTLTGLMSDQVPVDPVAIAASGLETLQQSVEKWPDHWMTWVTLGSGLYVSGFETWGSRCLARACRMGEGRFLPRYLTAISLEFSWLSQNAGEGTLQRILETLDEAGREASALGDAEYEKWVRDAKKRVTRHLASYR